MRVCVCAKVVLHAAQVARQRCSFPFSLLPFTPAVQGTSGLDWMFWAVFSLSGSAESLNTPKCRHKFGSVLQEGARMAEMRLDAEWPRESCKGKRYHEREGGRGASRYGAGIVRRRKERPTHLT